MHMHTCVCTNTLTHTTYPSHIFKVHESDFPTAQFYWNHCQQSTSCILWWWGSYDGSYQDLLRVREFLAQSKLLLPHRTKVRKGIGEGIWYLHMQIALATMSLFCPISPPTLLSLLWYLPIHPLHPMPHSHCQLTGASRWWPLCWPSCTTASFCHLCQYLLTSVNR